MIQRRCVEERAETGRIAELTCQLQQEIRKLERKLEITRLRTNETPSRSVHSLSFYVASASFHEDHENFWEPRPKRIHVEDVLDSGGSNTDVDQ